MSKEINSIYMDLLNLVGPLTLMIASPLLGYVFSLMKILFHGVWRNNILSLGLVLSSNSVVLHWWLLNWFDFVLFLLIYLFDLLIIVLWFDNGVNPIFHSKDQACTVDIYFVHDLVLHKKFIVEHLPTKEQVADILRKPLIF